MWRRKLSPAVLIALLGARGACADTISNWSDGIGNWSVASNWTPPVVPNNSAGTGYDVTVGGIVTLDISPTINSLNVPGGGFLTGPTSGPAPLLTVVNGATINGSLFFGEGLTNPVPYGPASLSVGGDLDIGSSAVFLVGDGSLTVGGNFTNAARLIQLYSVSGADQFQVAGTFTNQQGSVTLLGGGRCFNVVGCNGVNTGFYPTPVGGPATSLGTLVNNGQIYSWSNITASALVNNGSTSFVAGQESVKTLQNAGTIYLANSCCSTSLEPTTTLNVGTGTGNSGYNQFGDGVLDEVLRGSSTYGTIVAGEGGYQVSLGGTLDIMLQNGFTPTFGESFTILTTAPGDLSGTFGNVMWDAFEIGGRQGYFSVFYNDAAGDVVITAEPVPEPSTLLLLAPPLGFVFWRNRRRNAL